MTTTKGHRYRSGLEREMARQLRLSGRDFWFEEDKIDYIKPAKKAKYNPDFHVIKKKDGSKMYLEGKGRFLTSDRQKHRLIREQHPDLDIRFVFQNARQRISKTSNTTYAKWCEKYGFKYSDKGIIPKEWLEE
ncbi:hypothetical protein [Maritalea mediterranea]|uniref:Endonuclease I n=1 Tax=Maritalea mediterranea TaxID=2909667 RepID=A0ABS9EA92_9HYPH|nr:hypothetical protein [Maritalea mediterranea]MCF4099806.1 hypothetical protein [Maritalea mediterranea]